MGVLQDILSKRTELQKGFASIGVEDELQHDGSIVAVFEPSNLDKYMDDIEKSMYGKSDAEQRDILEKAKKDLSKLTKKVVVDKNGKRKTVYVKQVKAPEGHKHPTDKHAEAVEVYKTKKRYMSKEKAKAHVEKHYGKEHADYAAKHHNKGLASGSERKIGAYTVKPSSKKGEFLLLKDGMVLDSGNSEDRLIALAESEDRRDKKAKKQPNGSSGKGSEAKIGDGYRIDGGGKSLSNYAFSLSESKRAKDFPHLKNIGKKDKEQAIREVIAGAKPNAKSVASALNGSGLGFINWSGEDNADGSMTISAREGGNTHTIKLTKKLERNSKEEIAKLSDKKLKSRIAEYEQKVKDLLVSPSADVTHVDKAKEVLSDLKAESDSRKGDKSADRDKLASFAKSFKPLHKLSNGNYEVGQKTLSTIAEKLGSDLANEHISVVSSFPTRGGRSTWHHELKFSDELTGLMSGGKPKNGKK